MSDAERKRRPVAGEPEPQPKGSVTPGQESRIPRFAELDAEIAAQAKQEARVKARRSALPKKPQSKRRRPGLPRAYRQAIIHVAAEHREEFKVRFAKDPGLRDRGARLYRTLVFPRPRGNKPTKRVLTAVVLIQELGHRPTPSDWTRIYSVCLPRLAKMLDHKRRDLCRTFQHTVGTYLRRHKIPPYCVTGTLIASEL
jgi:hypothetical protein